MHEWSFDVAHGLTDSVLSDSKLIHSQYNSVIFGIVNYDQLCVTMVVVEK